MRLVRRNSGLSDTAGVVWGGEAVGGCVTVHLCRRDAMGPFCVGYWQMDEGLAHVRPPAVIAQVHACWRCRHFPSVMLAVQQADVNVCNLNGWVAPCPGSSFSFGAANGVDVGGGSESRPFDRSVMGGSKKHIPRVLNVSHHQIIVVAVIAKFKFSRATVRLDAKPSSNWHPWRQDHPPPKSHPLLEMLQNPIVGALAWEALGYVGLAGLWSPWSSWPCQCRLDPLCRPLLGTRSEGSSGPCARVAFASHAHILLNTYSPLGAGIQFLAPQTDPCVFQFGWPLQR